MYDVSVEMQNLDGLGDYVGKHSIAFFTNLDAFISRNIINEFYVSKNVFCKYFSYFNHINYTELQVYIFMLFQIYFYCCLYQYFIMLVLHCVKYQAF